MDDREHDLAGACAVQAEPCRDAASKRVLATDIQRFKAECVNPPAGTKSIDWIKAGFPGAKCD